MTNFKMRRHLNELAQASTGSQCKTKRPQNSNPNMNLKQIVTLSLVLTQLIGIIESSRAQFLFTYEINPESDDSRVPKSSLFDPSSFKIVTPSQLQSSYQKLTSQLDAAVSAAAGAPPPPPPAPSQQSAPIQHQQQPLPVEQAAVATQTPVSSTNSLLKQTSAALQSFAELFSLSSPQVSSPSPLSALGLPTPPESSLASVVNQEAEARSLHEHWRQQQQRSHGHLNQHQNQNPALNSFTTSLPQPQPQQHQQHQQHQHHPQHQQQPSQASYWLTASPLNGPDGNYLVQIKQQQQQQNIHKPSVSDQLAPSVVDHNQQVQHQQPQMLDNLLAVGQRASRAIGGHQQPPKSAQASFLSTPTSYYPGPSSATTTATAVSESPRVTSTPPTHHHHHHHHHQQHQQAQSSIADSFQNLAQPQQTPRHAQSSFMHTTMASVAAPLPVAPVTELQPPANMPENFQLPSLKQHKSAEESLMLFRQRQQDSSEPGPFSQSSPARFEPTQASPGANQNHHHHQHSPGKQVFHQPSLPAGRHLSSSSSSSSSSSDIPKVSPQIYESFLLQQKDQHEKHMELLKQQQELNRLLEQKQKQQREKEEASAAELKRKNLQKKRLQDEQEVALAKKKAAARAEEQARKALKLEQEERELRRRRDEEERRRVVAAAEEQRRYREYLEAREKEKREREAAAAASKRAQEEREAAELIRQREEAERLRVAAEQLEIAKRRKEKEAEEAKFARYLRQQEELKKLLELKQKEDEASQQRRRQAGAASMTAGSSGSPPGSRASSGNQASRARSLALEHRERSGSPSTPSWGAPLRSRVSQQTTLSSTTGASFAQETAPTTSSSFAGSSSTSTTPLPIQVTINEKPHRGSQRIRAVKKQRHQSNSKDENLIRQKIPLYSGPGQYGLYRGNDSTFANDLAALLDSVTLPSSTTTTTTTSTTSTTTTPAPALDMTTRQLELGTASFAPDTSSSLSPLLDRSLTTTTAATRTSFSANSQPFAFDDDVPRRPARELSGSARLPSARSQLSASSHALVSSATSNSFKQTRTLATGSNETSSTSRSESGGSRSNTGRAHIGLASLPADSDNDGIPGRAGVEYPVLSQVPPTSFSCSKQPLNGYYADTETACQVVHLCQGGVQSSILCPNGTIFNQEKFSCQWWYEVNCSRAPIFYQLNDNLYKSLQDSSGSSSDFSKKKATGSNGKPLVPRKEKHQQQLFKSSSSSSSS